MQKTEPLVGGESARLILDTIRSFPLTVRGGRAFTHDTATGAARAALDRAYEIVEMQVVVDAAHCTEDHVHKTVDELEFRHMVLRELVRRAKKALGESEVLDPMWEREI